jgi:CRISPR-associated protein Cas2
MVVICLSDVADRIHGYLRSVMLNVHPGVFVSMDLDAGARERVFNTVQGWWTASPRGSVVYVARDTTKPLGIDLRNLGVPKREVVEYDGIFGIRRSLQDNDKF